ncbi:MAG: hypothetical protein ACLQVA_06690 [Candidatus Brocadiia bacterium]
MARTSVAGGRTLRCCIVGLLLIFAAWPAGFGAEKLAWRDAEVELSDGRTVAGQVALVNDQLIIHNDAQAKKYTVRLAEMKQLESLVEKESMEKKWFFKEDGRDEKVYTGEVYPVRYFNTRVTFGDGRTLEGHIISTTAFLKVGDDAPERLFLTRQIEGKVGQKLDDIVYVKRIALKGEAAGVLGSIRGTVRLPAGEKLAAVIAINCQDDTGLTAELAGEGAFKFTDCTRGAYDLIVLSDRAIYAGFSAEKAADSARLGAGTLKEISDWSKNVRDFFDSHDPLYGAGNLERAYVLIRMERARERPNTLQADTMFRRYEVWLMAKPEDEWVIAKRFVLQRGLSAGKDIPRERMEIRPELAGQKVSAERSDLTLSLQLAGGAAASRPSN